MLCSLFHQRALICHVAGVALEQQYRMPQFRPAAERVASLRPVIATVAPFANNWHAVSRPMPLVPPVSVHICFVVV
jgi:hypothetical protein